MIFGVNEFKVEGILQAEGIMFGQHSVTVLIAAWVHFSHPLQEGGGDAVQLEKAVV